MANVLQSAGQFFQNKFQDDEGWFRQGKFTPKKQIQSNLSRLRNVDIASTTFGGAVKAFREPPKNILETVIPPIRAIRGAYQNIIAQKPSYLSEQVEQMVPGKWGSALGLAGEIALPNVGFGAGDIRAGTSLLKRAGKVAFKSAPFGALLSAAEAPSLKEAPKYALGGGLFSGLFGAGLTVAPPAISKLVGKKIKVGDLASEAKKYKSAEEFVRDKHPDLVGDAEALDFALNLPTKAETVVKRPANIKQLRELLARQAEDQKNWDRQFGKVVSEVKGQSQADKSLFAGTMTPKQYSNLQTKRVKSREAFNKRTLNESLKSDGGYRAYKGGKTPATEGLPSQELLKVRKDKSPFAFQRETVKRNIEDVFGRKSAMNEFITGNLTKNELNATKQRNTIRQQITGISNKYQIRRGSKADKAAADFIEGNISKEQIKQQFGTKAKGIVALAEEGRKTYKTLLEQINAEITQYGYEPIKERQNYVTHTKQILGLGDQIGSILNLKQGELPRAMASINVDVKPGKKFFGFGLQRKGGATHEGLLVSLDKYLNSATRQIHHTSDIQRGRAVLDLLQKSGDTNKTMSNFTSYFGQYVDSIAGKQNIIDRPFEKVIGRKVMAMGDWARKKTGANMVGGNISSALTNFIPFTQSLATTNKLAAGEGLIDAATNVSKQPSIIDGTESGFLARRFPTERMGKDTWSSIKDGVGFLFRTVDKFTSTSIVAGKYREGLQKGLSKLDAMKGADDYAARVLADRTFGQTPLLFNSRVLGALTQFQLEVNNQVSFLTKDIPKNLDFNKGQAASALIQFTIYSYLLNEFYEKATGRRPQIDPIYMALTSQGLTPEGEGQDFAGKGRAIIAQARQGIPFASEGRLPVGAAIPDVGALIKGESDLMTEIKKPAYYLAPPFGGGQIKKTVEGIQAGQRGYSETKSGLARFPVKPSIKTAVFGQWSTPEAREYFAKKQRPLGKTQTESLKQMPDKQSFFKTIQVKRAEARDKSKRAEILKEGAGGFDVKRTHEYYNEDSNEVRVLNYGKVLDMPSATRVDKVKKDKETYSFVKSVINSSIPQEKKNELIGKVGVSDRDAQYYSLASESVDVRLASVYDMLDGVKSRDKILEMLANGRREVNGDMVVTNPIIDDFYDEGLITYAEKKYLKSLKQNKLGKMTTGRAKGTGRKLPKPKFRKHTAPRVAKVKLPARKASFKTKPTKLKVNIKRTIPRVKLKTK